jgi:uncharacterized protein
MPANTLREMTLQFARQCAPGATISWQGGEPTLMGLAFFEEAVGLQHMYGMHKGIHNTFQTNGMLIDRDWARFFKRERVLVGVSIDGPAAVHDLYRKNRGRTKTHHIVTEKCRLLLEEDVAVNALCCITDQSARYPEEIYEHLKSIGFRHMQFIPVVEKKGNRVQSWSVTPERYGKFLNRIFDLWISDFSEGKPTTHIRYFEDVFHRYLGLSSPDCVLSRECGSYVLVEHNGDVYSCDFFAEDTWRLGNLMYKSLAELLNSKRQNRFGKQKRDLDRTCRQCTWYDKCYGGCPKDRKNNPSNPRLSYFCDSYKMFFQHCDSRLRTLAVIRTATL